MSAPLAAPAVLDRIYLDVRCKLLDIAASLDRLERSEGAESVSADPRLAQIAKGIEILNRGGVDRAEQIQMLFSDPYIPHWNRRDKAATNGAGKA